MLVTKDKTILISCPVRDRSWILPEYLDHICSLDYPKDRISILWVVNQSTDNSEEILKKFKRMHQHEYLSIQIKRFVGNKKVPKDERKSMIRNSFIYNHLAEVRNYIFDSIGYHDYLFSCDSDILVKPNTLKKLLSHNENCMSGLIYNGFLNSQTEPWRYPNILRRTHDGKFEHIANTYVKNAPSLNESKVKEVGATGALVLMSREVCQNTRYGFHHQGEDIYWSNDCYHKGYKLYCDYSAYAFHAMNKDLLQQYITQTNLDILN